jgi:hypothetical protein
MRNRFVRGVTAIAGAFSLVLGAWALVASQPFYDTIAGFPPYNQHFIHDIGAFQIAIGLALLLALVWSDALTVVLVAGAAGNVLHFHLASHRPQPRRPPVRFPRPRRSRGSDRRRGRDQDRDPPIVGIGGSAWGSNPPTTSERCRPPVLKTGEAT